MEDYLYSILSRFRTDGEIVSCTPYGSGHINSTFLAVTSGGRRYILQSISDRAFKDIPGLMENMRRVTEHLRKKTDDPRRVLRIVGTKDGGCYVCENGVTWRMVDYVEDSLCLLLPESDEDFYQSAVAFADFLDRLSDFPAGELCETIPDFHNTPFRFRQFKEALASDPLHRAGQVREEIAFALCREKEMGTLQTMRESGELPLRVTHNDTKLSNVLLDAKTRTALCVIDLDTVMPGLIAYDYGDAVRSGATTAREDEKDLSRVRFDLQRFRVFTRGFLQNLPALTEKELETLPMGAKTMIFENGLRFLTDYINGDTYYPVDYPTHNLDRCHTQFALLRDMEEKWETVQEILLEEESFLKQKKQTYPL